MSELFKKNARTVVAMLKAGDICIKDTLDSVQQRMESTDTTLNSLPTECFDRASEHANKLQNAAVEKRGALCGLPVTIKDLTDVASVRTTYGSSVFAEHIPEKSNQLVTRIEQQGGVIYAKSNTPEFGAGGVTFNDVLGTTKNPYNTSLNAGGSSGGAAASLASGCAWLSHGSDMAGSLRTPASFCGVTSLRPSPGTIRSDSLHLPFDVLGADGPMARDLGDLALFADVMRNSYKPQMQQAVKHKSTATIAQLKVAISTDLGITTVDRDVADLFQRFVDTYLNKTTKVQQAHPDLDGVHDCFDALRAHVFAIGLEGIIDANRDKIKPEVVWNVEQGSSLTSTQIRKEQRSQGKIVRTSASFMDNYDVLICPASSVTRVAAEERYPGASTGLAIDEYYRWLAIAYATTMTTLPIITLPVSNTDDGLPFAVQLIGKPWGEAALFQVAKQIERQIDRDCSPINPRP